MTGFLGALSDAWAEIRVHKLRVLLSLIGIAVSVGALTAVVAISEYQRQFQEEQSDRWGGRAATVVVAVSADDGTRSTRTGGRALPQGLGTLRLQSHRPDRPGPLARRGAARRRDPGEHTAGRPCVLADPPGEAARGPVAARRRPRGARAGGGHQRAAVGRIGRVPVAQHPTITVTGDAGGTYQVVGVVPRQGFGDEELRLDLLYDAYRDRVDALPEETFTQYEVARPRRGRRDRAGARDGPPRRAAGGADGVGEPLGLGGATRHRRRSGHVRDGHGRHRVADPRARCAQPDQHPARRDAPAVREIGVRRAFGASSGRVFFAVFLESLVATTVAGRSASRSSWRCCAPSG